MKKLLLLLLLLSINANAEKSIKCVDSGYIDLDSNQLYYGLATYERYDGECRPLEELSKDKWSYSVKKLNFRYEICKKDKCIFLPIDKHLSYDFGFKRITVTGVFNNISDISKSLFKNNCKEIILGNSLNWERKNHKWKSDYFLWDEEIDIIPIQKKKKRRMNINIKQKNITKKHGSFLIKNNNLVYQICKENIDKDINGYKFIFHSYIINGVGGDSTWSEGQFSNTTEKLTTNQLQLNWSNWSNGLVGYWNFDGGSLADQTGISDGSCSGDNCPDVTNGKYGKAMEFDGVDDYVDCGSDVSLNMEDKDFSFGIWIKPISYDSGWHFFIGSESGGASLGLNILTLQLTKTGVADAPSSETQIPLNIWSYVAVVFNSFSSNDNLKYYINGVLVKTVTFNQNFDSDAATKYIGTRIQSNGFFNGSIDEVRIYNRILLSKEINQSMKNSKYYNGQYVTNNISCLNNLGIKNITIDYIDNQGEIDGWYLNNENWDLILYNMMNNITYNISSMNNIKVKLNISTDNNSLTPEVNQIILGCGVTTTTTTTIKTVHQWINKKPIRDSFNIETIIIIGVIILIFIVLWVIIK